MSGSVDKMKTYRTYRMTTHIMYLMEMILSSR